MGGTAQVMIGNYRKRILENSRKITMCIKKRHFGMFFHVLTLTDI